MEEPEDQVLHNHISPEGEAIDWFVIERAIVIPN